MKNYHILVLAMSDLNRIQENYYAFFNAKGESTGRLFYGIGQLEPVPQHICATQAPITHYVILQTPTTQWVLRHDWKQINEIIKKADGAEIDYVDGEAISAVSFFEKRIRALYLKNGYGFVPEFIPVALDETNVQGGVTDLLRVVRDLYKEYQEEKEEKDWKLWIDIHGGFRDAALAVFALLQTLSAPDEQDLISGKTSRIDTFLAHLTDGKSTIPVEKVYTVNFTPKEKGSKDNPQPILDKTEFYQLFTKESLNAYMNYGQYAQLALHPLIDLKQEPIPLYAFISYRRMDAPKERASFLGVLKKNGYRYWYDDSIPLQSDWAYDLKTAIERCSVFIALISEHYFESYQCVKELKQAITENKLIILVGLDKTPLYVDKEIKADEKDKDGNTINTIEITKEQMIGLAKKQHINYQTLMQDGVFQASALAEKLNNLCKDIPTVKSIRE